MVSGQAAGDVSGRPAGSLLLQLVIADTEPLSGWLCPQQPPAVRVEFSGWIGLMSAINELRAGQPPASAPPVPNSWGSW